MALPPMAQTPDSLTEMTRLIGGDLSGSLTSGDKLLALSGLLRSVTRSGRRAGITPEQVIGNLRQQKLAELQNRMAVEQMRAQQAQAQRAKALREQIRGRLTPQQQAEFDLLSDQEVAALSGKRLESQLIPSREQISARAREISEASGYPVGSPEHQALMRQDLSLPRTMMTSQGLVEIPGLEFPQPPPPPPAPPPPPPEKRILQQRPPGLTDDELFAKARQAVEDGVDVNDVFQQLKAWGVKI